MSFFDSSRAAVPALHFTFPARAFAALRHWQKARQTRVALARLSDRELTDIGLSRCDIDRVAREV
ncbi:DUF1127 domain-containing protein [Paracoccus jiaweipingae]|uniref:DUF1127 domain-containing protein n=1 Tax=unclassified Paracoccus (in: a-proteobacteria) TaxID=2688777 RepID=UPI0037956915